jgi:hypothetical protein
VYIYDRAHEYLDVLFVKLGRLMAPPPQAHKMAAADVLDEPIGCELKQDYGCESKLIPPVAR